MATLGPLELAGRSGAAFMLLRPPREDMTIAVGDWTVDVARGVPYLVAHTVAEIPPDGVLAAAHEPSQEGLDLLSATGGSNLATTGVLDERIIWWHEGDRAVVRVVGTSPLSIGMGVTVTRIDASGKPEPDTPPTRPQWSSAFRYFRLSQVTADLFDAYRNLWLAFEQVLSVMVPLNPGEPETRWLKRALVEVGANTALAQFVSSPSAEGPAADVYREQYLEVRCRLFHAKSGRPRLMPQSAADRVAVTSAINQLARLFIALMQRHFTFTRPSGCVTYQGFSLFMGWMKTSAQLWISPSANPSAEDETLASPAWQDARVIGCSRSDELSEPGKIYVLGRVDLRKEPLTFPVQRIALTEGFDRGAETAISVHRLVAPLECRGLDELQIQDGIRLVNVGLPRVDFAG